MRKILLAGILVLSMIAATSMVSSSSVVYTSIINGNGVISVDQYGHKNVEFQNQMKVGTGTLNFKQNIYTNYGHFYNTVRLNGKDLRINNIASEQYVPGHWSGTGVGWVKSHRSVTFSQQLYVGESSKNWDEAKAEQVFYMGHNYEKYIAQKVQVNPTENPGHEVEPDRLFMFSNTTGQYGIMNSKFIQPSFGGRATLHQTGKMHADYDFAKQWSNIGGVSGSSVVSWNNPNWVHFDQGLTFIKN